MISSEGRYEWLVHYREYQYPGDWGGKSSEEPRCFVNAKVVRTDIPLFDGQAVRDFCGHGASIIDVQSLPIRHESLYSPDVEVTSGSQPWKGGNN